MGLGSPAVAGAIVVLGARVDVAGQPSAMLRSRVEHAAQLFAQRAAPLLVRTGGSAAVLPSEAAVGRALAVTAGVPSDCCLLEERSRSTRENARFCAALLKARGIAHVLLVTDPYHLPRATMLFRREGIDITPAPATRTLAPSSALSRFWCSVRELPALARDWLLTR